MEYAFYFLIASTIAACLLYVRWKIHKRRNNMRTAVSEHRPFRGYASDLPNCVLQPNSTTGVRGDSKGRA